MTEIKDHTATEISDQSGDQLPRRDRAGRDRCNGDDVMKDSLGDPALPSGSRASTEPSDAVSAVPASIPIAEKPCFLTWRARRLVIRALEEHLQRLWEINHNPKSSEDEAADAANDYGYAKAVKTYVEIVERDSAAVPK